MFSFKGCRFLVLNILLGFSVNSTIAISDPAMSVFDALKLGYVEVLYQSHNSVYQEHPFTLLVDNDVLNSNADVHKRIDQENQDNIYRALLSQKERQNSNTSIAGEVRYS